MKTTRTMAQAAVAHARQLRRKAWSDAEVVASLYDEDPGLATAVSHSASPDGVRVVYKDGSEVWVTWDKNGMMHFTTVRGCAPGAAPAATPEPQQHSTVDDIVAYEEGAMPDDEVPAFFQRLIDSGLIDNLQGSYQRTAWDLIASGKCHRRSS